jgi:ferredoxin-NADP reductase
MPAIETGQWTPTATAEVGAWQTGTVDSITDETYRVKTFRVSLSDWNGFRPGQHVDVRLTAPDGYQAQRSYSIASPPEIGRVLDLTVELVEDGEVSPWFHQVAKPGDVFELRGPIGGPFTWTVDDGGALLLFAGGSGVAPLMSMLRHRQAQNATSPALLLYSSRKLDDVIYRDELEAYSSDPSGATVLHTLTREHPPGFSGYTRRIDREMIEEVLREMREPSAVFICGPTAFVEGVAARLVAAGVDAERIRTERFGPTG